MVAPFFFGMIVVEFVVGGRLRSPVESPSPAPRFPPAVVGAPPEAGRSLCTCSGRTLDRPACNAKCTIKDPAIPNGVREVSNPSASAKRIPLSALRVLCVKFPRQSPNNMKGAIYWALAVAGFRIRIYDLTTQISEDGGDYGIGTDFVGRDLGVGSVATVCAGNGYRGFGGAAEAVQLDAGRGVGI